MTDQFIIDDCGTLIDKKTHKCYDYVSEVKPLLEKQAEEIQDLKCRINNIYAVLREEKCGDVE